MAAFNINLDSIKSMPPKRKALIIAVLYLLLVAAYYFFVLQETLEKKGSLETKLTGLQGQVAEKERLASQKNKYFQELVERQETLKMALTKLPDEREIPGLLYAVAQAGKDAEVEFLLFEPQKVVKKPPETEAAKAADKKPSGVSQAAAKPGEAKETGVEEKFYEEIPVKVTVKGSYHNTALFFEKVAKLPRIINIEEISMSEGKDAKARVRLLNTSCVIKTYMFLEKMGEKKADENK